MLQQFRHPLLILGTLVVFVVGFAMYFTFSFSMLAVGPSADELWPGTATWAEHQLESMPLEDKVSQLFSVRAYGYVPNTDDPEYRKLVDLVARFGIGGVTFFQGKPLEQAALANDLQNRAGVPLLISQDMEWGSGMRIEGGTTFPRTMALGAARDPRLAYLTGFVTGREARALGTHQVFAPVADVNNNPNNPIINVRSFGEQPRLVADLSAAFARGVQDAGAIATAKHFPGHGDTSTDSHLGLPVLRIDMDRLETLELVPFEHLIGQGIMSVMTGHLAFPEIESDENLPATLSARVTTELLRERLGFEGLIVTDGLDMAGVTSKYSTGEIAVRALRAGADLLLLSEDPYAAREAILRAVEEGRLTERRIDESVSRLLRAKAWLRLDASRTSDLKDVRRIVAADDHVALSRTVARRSLTLLRNEGGAIPLRSGARILSVTLSDDDSGASVDSVFVEQLRRRLPPGQVASRLLHPGSEPADYEAILSEADTFDVVVVPAYVNVRSWSGRIDLSKEHAAFLTRLVGGGPPVVLVSFGNPYIAMALPQPEAYLAAYSESEASQIAVAEALVGRSAITGRLPITIPGLYPYGQGIDLPQRVVRTGYAAEVGLNGHQLAQVDSLIYSAIVDRAFPGAALAIGRGGVVAKLDGYGYFTYDSDHLVTPESVFDLASLTKVVATTMAAMKLYDEGRLDLDARVVEYLPEFGQSGKDQVTVRQLLTHSSGLIPYRAFHVLGITSRRSLIDSVMAEKLIYKPGTESRYSDLGMITLMLVIECITGQSFDEYVQTRIFEPLGMHNTGFRGTGNRDPSVVPTELDAYFRHRLIQGEVHDETAWILGGVSGHAGVFSTVEDLTRFAYMLMNEGRVDGEEFISPETIRLFTRVQDPDLSTRALGWDTKSPDGYTSAGTRFGPNSFGHTGFTGTSLWIDPDADLFVIFLTNRVFPTRENGKITEFRPRLADAVHSAIIGPPSFVLPIVEP